MKHPPFFSYTKRNLPAFLVGLFLSVNVAAQKVHYIEPQHENIAIAQRNFYIDKVADERYSKSELGWINGGRFKSRVPVDFENSLGVTLKEFFDAALPRKEGQIPITLVVKVLKVSEENEGKYPLVRAVSRMEFHYKGTQVYWIDEEAENRGDDVHRLMEQSLTELLIKNLENFVMSNWEDMVEEQAPQVVIDNKFENPDYAYHVAEADPEPETNGPITYSEAELKELIPGNRNVFVIGFGIGGHSLIGTNYEVRIGKIIGIHGGFGYLGWDYLRNHYFTYTAGVKIHTSEGKNSPFVNVSYKDAGLGIIGTAGVEFGDRFAFSKKKDFGMVWQVGLGIITNMDESRVYLDSELPITLTTGIGFSFRVR